jgi:DNA-binding response OmpR family regulator
VSVLVVEDDRITARVLHKQLRALGHDVRVVHAGSAAWELLGSDAPPLVAVLDWTIPDISGPELCRKVRARPNVPYTYLLLLTGRDQEHDVAAGIGAGADEYIKKPYNLDDLLQRVTHGLQLARTRRSLWDTTA